MFKPLKFKPLKFKLFKFNSLNRSLLILITAILLSACGMFENKHQRDYLKSKSVTPLDVNAGEQTPPLSHAYDIPQTSVSPEKDPAKLDALEKPPAFDAKAQNQEGVFDTDTPKLSSGALNVREARNTEGYNLLVVEAKFDRAWDSVGQALVRMGFQIEDKDRGGGNYSIYQTINRVMDTEEKFLRPRNDKGLREEYQVHVEDHEDLTRVYVRTKDGKVDDSDLAKHLLVQLRYQLEHPEAKKK